MKSKRENNKVITAAFARLTAAKDKQCTESMGSTLRIAMEGALMNHNADHTRHIDDGSYGIALSHNSTSLILEVDDKADSEIAATVKTALRQENTPGSGFHGTVLALMTPADWYNTEYEVGLLKTEAKGARKRLKAMGAKNG